MPLYGVWATESRAIIQIMVMHIFRFPSGLRMPAFFLVAGTILAASAWAQGGGYTDLKTGGLRLEQVITPGFSHARALASKGGDIYPPFVLGVLDLERRRDLGREGGRQLAVEGEALSRQIADREAYMAELKDLAAKQEVVIQALKSSLERENGGRSRLRQAPNRNGASGGTTPEQYVTHIATLLVIALILSLGLYFRSRLAERRLIAAALRGEVDRRHSRIERRHGEAEQPVSPVPEKVVSAEPAGIPEEAPEPEAEVSVKVTRSSPVVDVAQELREIDTLLAYEDYEGAGKRLLELIEAYPENPEFRLRLLHLQSVQGDMEASAAESEILATMMDGPLSDTLRRVQSVGHEMLPGHPLFSASSEDATAAGARADTAASVERAVEENGELQKTQVLHLTPENGKK